MKEDRDRFMVDRAGDMFIHPFQCSLCWFRNLKLRDPEEKSLVDYELLVYIRRENLNMFWKTSVRFFSLTYSNFFESGWKSGKERRVMTREKGLTIHTSTILTQSFADT